MSREEIAAQIRTDTTALLNRTGAIEEMRLAQEIFLAIYRGEFACRSFQIETIDGDDCSEPSRIAYRIYHSDGYCMEVVGEMMADPDDDAGEYDEVMMPNGWSYYVTDPGFDGFKPGTLDMVKRWIMP